MSLWIEKFFQKLAEILKERYLTGMLLLSRLIAIVAAIGGYYFAQLNLVQAWPDNFKILILSAISITLAIQFFMVINHGLKMTSNLPAYLKGKQTGTVFYENIWHELLNFPENQILFEVKTAVLIVAIPCFSLTLLGVYYLDLSGQIIIHNVLGLIVGIIDSIIMLWFFYEQTTQPVLKKIVRDEPALLNVPIEPPKIGIRTRLMFIFTSLNTIPVVIMWSFSHEVLRKIEALAGGLIPAEIIDRFTTTTGIVGIVTIIIVIFFSYLLALSISRPINMMLPQIERLTMGDLQSSIDVVSRSEMGELAVAFNQLIHSIRFLVEEIQNAGAMIISSSFHILSVAQEQKDDSASQAAAISQIRNTVEGLAESFRQIADQAAKGQNLANDAFLQAQKGQELIDKNVEAFQKIREQSQKSIEKSENFVTQSHQINQIFEAIQTIVAQTKMIALNASIEAASAGASGRRFSVIAAEVRKLADQSTELLSEISRTVHVLQNSTLDLATAIETEILTIDDGVNHAERIQQVFADILEMTENNAQSVMHIASVASQQSSAYDQIVIGIRQLSGVANKIADTSTRLNDLTVQLDELSRKLTLSVQQFQN